MLEGVKRRTSMFQAFYHTFSIREEHIVSVSSNFLTQISHGTRTKCRKTRAMLRDFSTAACLALKQLRHFYGTRCLFAKIAIPCTIYPSLSLFECYVRLRIDSCRLYLDLLPYFLWSREVYRSSQQQFSCAQRAQRKFRMEAGRNFGKICQKLTFCYIPLFLCFQMLIC